MRSRATGVACHVLTILFALHVSAGPAARESIVRLTAASDAIVVGTVQATEGNATVAFRIQVERVLKGTLIPGSAVSLIWTSPRTQFPYGESRSVTGHGLFFLQRTSSGSWALLPATAGDAGWEDTYVATPVDVARAVRDAALASLPANASPLDGVLAEMVMAREADASMPFDFVEIFRESQSAVLASAFTRFRTASKPSLALIGLRGRVQMGDSSAISTAQQRHKALSSSSGWRALLEEIRVHYLNTSAQAIQSLGQIVTDPGTGMDLRLAAAGALARMHTRRSLPYLAALLDDRDSKLRTMAVGGLARFANNVPIGSHEPAPGPWPYRTDDTITHSAIDEARIEAPGSDYLSFWRSWWREHAGVLK